VWNSPIFVKGLATFQIFVQGIIGLYGNGLKGRKKNHDRSRISQRASKGKQKRAPNIFIHFGVQCKVFLQGFSLRARIKRAQVIFLTVFLHPLKYTKGTLYTVKALSGGYLYPPEPPKYTQLKVSFHTGS
jgi:hypothetical protein